MSGSEPTVTALMNSPNGVKNTALPGSVLTLASTAATTTPSFTATLFAWWPYGLTSMVVASTGRAGSMMSITSMRRSATLMVKTRRVHES
jgi:hypothetical protein